MSCEVIRLYSYFTALASFSFRGFVIHKLVELRLRLSVYALSRICSTETKLASFLFIPTVSPVHGVP